ncbi:hypothetical protein TKK_0009773 [Trichogramma kaykai]|uniref:Uncharacterized protein n=1 Tax=Trichogramma kaykai TaxID=54128 RepID=A0ABD2X151_9HYME
MVSKIVVVLLVSLAVTQAVPLNIGNLLEILAMKTQNYQNDVTATTVAPATSAQPEVTTAAAVQEKKPETTVAPATTTTTTPAALVESKDIHIESIEILEKIIGGLADRFGKAYVKTYDEQKASIDETIGSIKAAGKAGVESGVNLMKNGLEFFFIVPTFGKHIVNEG